MALKMTVNDKLEANVRQRNLFLADPVRVKKDLENERRLTRLQQVREKSSSLARHIRQEVSAEKERQVRNLEHIKQQELNTWREHVMAKKYQDYRTSMFQVGVAHRDAQAETEKAEQQKQQRVEKMIKCRRLAAKRAVKQTPTNVLRSTAGREVNVEGRVTAGTQTSMQGEYANANTNANDGKENRKVCNKKTCKDFVQHSSKRKRNGQQEKEKEALEMLSDSSSCSSVAGYVDEPTSNEPTGRNLQKTPPVILDLDIESEDSLEICSRDGIEINDLHKQTNRKFSRVVYPNPTNASELWQTATEPAAVAAFVAVPSRPRFTQITDLVRRTTQVTKITVEKTDKQAQEQKVHSQSPTRSLPRSPTKTASSVQSRSPRGSPTRPVAEKPTTSTRAQQTMPTDEPPRQLPQQKRSSLRSNNSKQSAPAKVIDAGLRRGVVLVPQTASVAANAASTVQHKTAKSATEPTKQQPRKQQPVQQPAVQQLPMQRMPMQQPPMQQPSMQQPPMQQPPMQQITMPQPQMQPLPPYMHPSMHPHAMYPPHIMPAYPILPYPMQPYPMQPLGQYAAPPPRLPSAQVPVTTSATSISATPVSTTASQSTVSTTTYVMRQGHGADTNTAATGHVQFYDHNNKYCRNYRASTEAVRVHQQDKTHLNAMDQARIENILSQLREQEQANLRHVTDQRGQKALQREQVRRDCAELTEKLEALTQQQPQLLPNDANFVPSHRFADMALRREQKMNAAMEEILLRPTIVTCPEVGVTSHRSPRKTSARSKSSLPDAINVGQPPPDKADDAVSTASCCSILLDYVNDQSKQLRSELKGMQSNSTKSTKLKSLLQRIEKIRAQLLAELQAGELNGDNAQKVIDSIRQERASIHTDTPRDINQREMELQQKEELLEQRLRQLYKQQQRVAGQQERRNKDENPVEIIIKVKSDGTVKQYVPKSKSLDKPNSKMTTEETTTSNKPTTTSSTSTGGTSSAPLQAAVLNERQHSIDSNSTSYRELPPVNYKNITPTEAPATTAEPAQTDQLHPMVAHYVQRLLGMSRNSIDQLGAVSSEVATPAESIINNPRNISSGSVVDETLIHSERVERVQAFIQENHSFVNELEDTLRSQQKVQEQQQQQQQLDKENSARAFDQMWNKHLTKRQQQQQLAQEQARDTELPTTSARANFRRRRAPVSTEIVSTQSTARSAASKLMPHGQHTQLAIAETTATRITETQRRRDEDSSSSVLNKSSTVQSATIQMERYAKLTENCTQRIAELTELITKVRKEKQRLVEVTLTSASEGDRHSTEYFELPPGQGQIQDQQQEQPPSRTLSERSDNHDTSPSHSEALPLQKHKPTGASLDSGISISRPVTAMGQEPPDAEPTSLGSSTQGGAPRRGRVPPATIRRYSPQLTAEELAHELSTITEVDTPAQSHIVAATPAARPFPTFDQYAQELQLDMASLDVNQSTRLQNEFHELIQAIKERGHDVDYREFPSISAYLNDITTTTTRVHIETQSDQPSMAARDLLKQLRQMPNVTIREFPNRREYLQQLLAHVPPEQRELIDSASLDSSDSLNVEAELRHRRILKTSFRRAPETSEAYELEVASSTRRESIPPNISRYAPNESGIDQLSRSPVTIDVQLDNQRMSVQRPISMRQTQRSPEPPNNAYSLNDRHSQRSAGGTSSRKSLDTPQEVSQLGRSLNLREFLTKELLKHRVHNRESSSDSTDDSLKSNFLQSIIDSLSLSSSSPQTPALGHGTNGTNDRQKTSTPVGSFLSVQDKSGSVQSGDPQLFSLESRISAVHYADGTPPVPYEQQTMSAAQGSGTPKPTIRKTLRK